MELDKRSFAWYNTELCDWYAATGEYEIMAAASSRDVRLTKTVRVHASRELPLRVHMNTTISELFENAGTREVIGQMAEILMAHMGGTTEDQGSAAAEAITPEMSLKMMENAPLRSLRSFMGMTTQEIEELIVKLNEAVTC